jgi:hypothetical protein
MTSYMEDKVNEAGLEIRSENYCCRSCVGVSPVSQRYVARYYS